MGWNDFVAASGLKKPLLKKLRAFIAYKDPEAESVPGEADPDLRDTENVPFTYEGGIEGFFEKEVKPYVPDAWVNEEATKIGYEISFTKYFYKPVELRELADIDNELKAVEKEAKDLLLNEKKQAMISKVVTRGLNPKAELVDSGVDWIGQVPKGWKVVPLKRVIISRESGAWGEDAEEGSGEICMRIADFDYNKGVFKDVSQSALTRRKYKPSELEWIFLKDGDILVEKSGGGDKFPVGRAVLFDKKFKAGYANFMDRIRVDEKCVLPKYFLHWWRTMYAKSIMWPYVKQTTGIQNLAIGDLLVCEQIVFPPLPEQREIVAYLDGATAKIDAAVAAIEKSIGLLKERRTRLVSDAVTGRIDLRKETA